MPAGLGNAFGACVSALAVLFFVLWETVHRGVYDYASGIYPISDADEWRYTACSRLVLHGYSLFSEVFSAQPPLFFALMAGGMRIFGDSLAGARWTELVFGLMALGSVAGTAVLLDSMAAGVTAVAVLAVSPGFLIYFHTVEAEGPMLALVALSLALTLWAKRIDRLALFGAAGLVLAGAILVKLFAAEAVMPAAWVLATYVKGEKSRLRAWYACASFTAGLCVPLGINFGFFHRMQQWDQVVTLHDRAASLHLAAILTTSDIFSKFAALDLGLTLLSVTGFVVLALQRRWFPLGFLLLWLGGTTVMLLAFHPLFPHHLAVLLAPMGCSASITVSAMIGNVPYRHRAARMVAVAAVVVYVGLLARIVHADRHVLLPQSRPQVVALALFVQKNSQPHDRIAVDDLQIAEQANRLVAPPLCDPSNVRLQAGYLGSATVIAALTHYQVSLVVPSFGIYAQIHGLKPWLRSHYRVLRAPTHVQAYVRR